MSFIIQSNKITFDNGYSIDFEYPIKEAMMINDVLIIVVESPYDLLYKQNVFALDLSGDFLWRIDDVELFYNGDNCVYVGVELNKKNELVLFNWCDTAVIVDPQTGNVIRTYQTK